jgi:predicted N-formylglutamate amidohydrolase
MTEVPGNLRLSEADRAARRAAIFEPYHRRIGALLDQRAAAGKRTFLVAQHSMTNLYKGTRREMHAAILYNRDRRFAGLMLNALRRHASLHIADNEPYFVSDETDYTIPKHGEARGLPHVEIELRQDLIGEEAGEIEWAARLSEALRSAEAEFLRSFP